MRLSYNILWIEDQTEFVESMQDEFESFLQDLGFKLVIMHKDDPKYLDDSILSDPRWNLILMDYTLEDEIVGTDIIKKIRGLDVNTEIVFYSSDSTNLKNHIQQEPLEGVYWADRTTNFAQKVKNIVELTIRKVMDLTNMRGLVMAEVADIDHIINDIIGLHHGELDSAEQTTLRHYIINKVLAHATKSSEKYSLLLANGCELDICLDHRTIDSSKRLETLTHILKDRAVDKETRQKSNSFTSVLSKRNDLAHGRGIVHDGAEAIQGAKEIFTLENAKSLRINLLEYRDYFEELLNKLKSREQGKA